MGQSSHITGCLVLCPPPSKLCLAIGRKVGGKHEDMATMEFPEIPKATLHHFQLKYRNDEAVQTMMPFLMFI